MSGSQLPTLKCSSLKITRNEGFEYWKTSTFHFCEQNPDVEGLVEKIAENVSDLLLAIQLILVLIKQAVNAFWSNDLTFQVKVFDRRNVCFGVTGSTPKKGAQ